jgi:hypothetical protein
MPKKSSKNITEEVEVEVEQTPQQVVEETKTKSK